MQLSKYLGDKPFWKVTLRLALPIALQNVLTSSFALVDTMMVSRLGDLALSSVGMAGQWSWLITLLGFGLCSGMTMFVSQYWGIRDIKGIRRTLGIALMLCLIVSGVFMLVALISPESIIWCFNKDADVIAVGSRYLRIACMSYPAVVLTLVMSSFLRSTEEVVLPLCVSLVTVIVNAVANYTLIFGKFGFPEMGVTGAAIGTLISSWLGPILLMMFSLKSRNLLVGPIKELTAFTKSHLKEFLRRSLPVVFNEGLWALGMVILNIIYANMGYEYYAGMTIFKTFADLTFAFYAGMGNACVVMVGKSVGKGLIRRAIGDSTRFSVLVPLSTVVIGGLTVIFRHQLISVFSTGDNLSTTTLSTALSITVFCSLEAIIRNIPYIHVVGVFRSGGDTFTGMYLDMFGLWCCAIPGVLIAAHVFHLPFVAVVMVAYLIDDIPKAFFCIKHFLSRRWLKPVTDEGKAGLLAFNEGREEEIL